MPPVVLSDEATIQRVVDGRLSLSRYGDGEYKLVDGLGTRTQPGDPELTRRMREILLSDDPRVLVCILDLYSGKPIFGEWESRDRTTARWGTEKWAAKRLRPGKVYGCAAVTRLCHWALGDPTAWWALVRRIWQGRPVLLVSGSKKGMSTIRMLGNAASVETWDLDQKIGCWERYPSILRDCEDWAGKVGHGEPLVLAALGATATVLAYDLGTRDIQCLDIGHMAQSWRHKSPKEFDEP